MASRRGNEWPNTISVVESQQSIVSFTEPLNHILIAPCCIFPSAHHFCCSTDLISVNMLLKWTKCTYRLRDNVFCTAIHHYLRFRTGYFVIIFGNAFMACQTFTCFCSISPLNMLLISIAVGLRSFLYSLDSSAVMNSLKWVPIPLRQIIVSTD